MRILWSHVLTISAIAFITYHRQHSSSHYEVLNTYLPSLLSGKKNSLVGLASRFIQVALFGGIVYTSLECGYSLLTLLAYTLTLITRSLLLPVTTSNGFAETFLLPDKFRIEAWPRLSFRPIYSTSLSDFWGKRWHALFRRIFVAVGARPLSGLPERLMGIKFGKQGKMALGLLGAFMTSGVLHECCKSCFFWECLESLIS